MKAVLRYYWKMIKKRKWMFVFLCLTMLYHAILESYWAVILEKIANIITLPFSEERLSALYIIFFTYIALWSVHIIVWRVFEWIIPYFELGGMKDLTDVATERVMKKRYVYFQNEFSGGLVKKINRFAQNFERFIDWIIFEFLSNIFFLIIAFVLLFRSDPFVAYIMLGWSVCYMIFSSSAFIWKMRFDKKAADEDSKVGGSIGDSMANMFTVKSSALENSEYKNISNSSGVWKKKAVTSWLWSMVLFGVQHVWAFLIEACFLFYIIHEWKAGDFELGRFVLYQTILLILITKVWEFGRSMRNVFLAISEASEMVDILENIEDETDSETAKHHIITKGEIEFRNMNFGYEETSPPDKGDLGGLKDMKNNPPNPLYQGETSKLFSAFNLHIQPGEKIALVGHSGSGKTTLTNLLFRFFEPQSGGIYFDGIESKDFTYQSLRSQISLVPQHPEMFHRTLRENITLGKPLTDEEIWEALKKAQGYDFAQALPEKLDTMIGERGVKLSGGEKQRVAIARAFLDDSHIVVLDEATSALDSITESELQKGIFTLIENKTAIVIAHRLSTVMKMDRIVVMEKGRIIEEGSHTQLLEKGGKYADMWTHQRGGFLGEE